MSAKDNILARLHDAPVNAAPERPPAPLPVDQDLAARIRTFQTNMEAVHTEVIHCDPSDWRLTLQEVIRSKGIGQLAYGPGTPLADEFLPLLQSDDQAELNLTAFNEAFEDCKERLFFATAAGITSTRGAIAETGSLVLWPDSQEPRTLSLVPPIHIAVVDADRIYPDLTTVMREQHWADGMPTNALLISGPSKTADIEQTLAYGVHGPSELVVLIRQPRN